MLYAGKAFITKEQIRKMLNVPEDVDFIITGAESSLTEINFTIVTDKEIGMTINADSANDTMRTRVRLEDEK